VQVVNVNLVLDGLETQFVGRSVRRTAFHAAVRNLGEVTENML
jgi:hypothetical protein